MQQEAQAWRVQKALDPEKADTVAKSLAHHQSQMSDLLSDDQQDAWQAADKDYGQYKALQKFVGKANASATDLTSDSLTDVGKLKSGMQTLGNVSRKGTPTDVLARGFGDDGAEQLRQVVQDASDNQATRNAVKKATYAAPFIGAGATYLHHLLNLAPSK